MKLYSNEIVFRGHPDKVCDQISAALLDAYVKQDENTRAGIETIGGKGKILVTGEVTSKARVNVKKVIRRVLKDIGYNPSKYKIINNIGFQSPDIALGVDKGGAGDNGMMFGYACDDTKELLPTAMVILQKFAEKYDELRQRNPYFLPDGKAQITGIYDENFKLQKIKTFTICYQNGEYDRQVGDLILKIYARTIARAYNVEIEEFLINPTGKFLIGGFEADAGLTGRKIVVDTYHSFANVGGGAFSGKDMTKVDVSGAYKAREIAIRYLKEYKLKWCEVQLSYAIGREEPLAIYVDSNIGNIEPHKNLYEECKPKNIIKDLNLLKINYEKKARFGHFR